MASIPKEEAFNRWLTATQNRNNNTSSLFPVPSTDTFQLFSTPKKSTSLTPMKGHENTRFIHIMGRDIVGNVIFNEFGEFVDPLTMNIMNRGEKMKSYKINIDVNTEIKKMITTEVISEIKNLVDGVQSITDSVNNNNNSNKRRKEEEE